MVMGVGYVGDYRVRALVPSAKGICMSTESIAFIVRIVLLSSLTSIPGSITSSSGITCNTPGDIQWEPGGAHV